MILSISNEKKRYETKNDTKDLTERIEKMKDEMVELDLSGNYFSEEAMENIANYLSKCKKLQSINLSSAFLGLDVDKMHHNLIFLCDALKNHKLRKIDVSDNAISKDFPKEFGDLISNSTDLYQLVMKNCGLGKDGGNQLGECLMKIKDKRTLEILDLSQNRFFYFPEKLTEALISFDSLKELRLQYNTVEAETMLAFLKSFKDHSLEVFDIRDNFLSLEGSELLGDLYCKWNIRELRIGDCMMGNEGIKAFLKKANTKFIPMDLPGNIAVASDGIILDISYNEFEQDAVELLTEFCNRNPIKELSVFGNFYDTVDEVIEAVCKSKLLPGTVLEEEPGLYDDIDEEEEAIEKILEDKIVNL